MKRKLLSVLLVLCLAVCLLPVVALAAEDVSGYAKATSFAELKAAAADPGVTAINVINTEEGRILVTEDVDLTGKKLCVESTNLRVMENATLTLGSIDDLYFADAAGNVRVLEGGGTLVIGGMKLISGDDATAIFLVRTNGILVSGLVSLPDDAYPVNAGKDGSLFIVGDADSHGGTVPSALTVVMDAFGDGNTLNVLGDLTVGSFDDGEQNVNVAEGAKFTILDREPTPALEREDIPAEGTAYPRTQTVDIDGTPVEFPAYALLDENGDPTNYIRLRDLADLLRDSAGSFDVIWTPENGIELLSHHAYDNPNGSEGQVPFTGEQPYKAYLEETSVNGVRLPLTAFQIAYEGGGHTYYQLRDLGKALGFNVGWSAERGIFLETDKTYTDAD